MRSRYSVMVSCLVMCAPCGAFAQVSAPPRPTGRVSVFVTSDQRRHPDGENDSTSSMATSVTFRTPAIDQPGLEVGVDLRHTGYGGTSSRPQRLSVYDGFVGLRLGARGQVRARMGHLWLPDLGTAGTLAGALVEYRGDTATAQRWRAGAFAGAEPLGYEAGYTPGVRKFGGYVAFERGFLQRHVVGVTQVQHRGLSERTLLTVSNYIPAGRSVFVYQAMEYDLRGPANGAARGGLAYMLVNARASLGPRVDLLGTFNRGRALNARQLSDDVLNGRPLSPQAIEGFRYETVGGRLSLRLTRRLEIYGGYARDRNNRDDASTGRITAGGYAGDVLGTGLDLSGSNARIDRPSGAYHSTSFSLGRAIGPSWYVSADYSSSLAIVRYLRTDGVTIETRPSTSRISGNVSATLGRHLSVLAVVDYTSDDDLRDLRLMAGLTYRLR